MLEHILESEGNEGMQHKILQMMYVLFLCANAQAANHLVIAEIYGGGGNLEATWRSDFICVFNPTTDPIDLNGWSVQYSAPSGTTWQVTPLAGTATILPAGGYFLVKETDGNNVTSSTPLPTPDAVGTISMNAISGKVALCNSTTKLSGTASNGPTIVDFVGYGLANSYEGSGPASTISNTVSAQRLNGGYTDTDDNFLDFTTGLPTPRNACGCSTQLTPVSPGTGTDTGYIVSSLTPTFSWIAPTDAKRYGLYISHLPYGSTNIIYLNTNLTGNGFEIPYGYLQGSTKYRWNMTSFDSLGNESSVSGSLYFQSPILQPTILTQPESQTAQAGDNVSWFLDVCNGQQVASGIIRDL